MHALRICGHLPPGTLNDLFLMIEKVKTYEQGKIQPTEKRIPRIDIIEESKTTDFNGITLKEEDLISKRSHDTVRMTIPN
jgi:hypothetical protein